jgi:hypothetical protein
MRLVGWAVLGMFGFVGCAGEAGVDGQNGNSCTVVHGEDGGATLTCEDGTNVVIRSGVDGQNGEDGADGQNGEDGADGQNGEDGRDGKPGQDGAVCSVADDGEGNKNITCPDGTYIHLRDGTGCTVRDEGNGRFTLSCEDGSQVSWTVPRLDCEVAFDDAYAADVYYVNPFYNPYGIHFEADALRGVVDGMENGDSGNWRIQGSNGPAAWGVWSGPHAIFFDSPVRDFRMDFLRGHADLDEMVVSAFLAGNLVGTQTVSLYGPFAVAPVSFEGLDADRISWNSPEIIGADNITYRGFNCLTP